MPPVTLPNVPAAMILLARLLAVLGTIRRQLYTIAATHLHSILPGKSSGICCMPNYSIH